MGLNDYGPPTWPIPEFNPRAEGTSCRTAPVPTAKWGMPTCWPQWSVSASWPTVLPWPRLDNNASALGDGARESPTGHLPSVSVSPVNFGHSQSADGNSDSSAQERNGSWLGCHASSPIWRLGATVQSFTGRKSVGGKRPRSMQKGGASTSGNPRDTCGPVPFSSVAWQSRERVAHSLGVLFCFVKSRMMSHIHMLNSAATASTENSHTRN